MSSTYQTEAIAKDVSALFPLVKQNDRQRGNAVMSHFVYVHLTRQLPAASNESPSGLVYPI